MVSSAGAGSECFRLSGTQESAESMSSQPRPAAAGVLRLPPQGIPRALAFGALMLIVLGVLGQVARWEYASDHRLVGVFDLDAEKNVPALYSGVLMMLGAMSLWLCRCAEWSNSQRRYWGALSIGLLAMAVDEVFAFHETLIDPMRRVLGNGDLGVFTFAWVIPGVVLVAALGIAFKDFLVRLPRASRARFLWAGAVFLAGAILMEMVGGKYYATYGSDLLQSLIAASEEALEFFGMILLVRASLMHLSEHSNGLVVKFDGRRP